MIETGRLVLRGWKEADKAPFHAMCNDPAVMEYLGAPLSHAEIDAATARQNALQAERGYCFWAVERKADGELLGFCGLKLADTPGTSIEGVHEVGWRLREDAWGQGYAQEAAIASLDLAFGRFAAPRVVAVTAHGNAPSQKLMVRLGMIRRAEFDFVDQRFPPGSDVNPQVVFAIEAADWPAARAAALG